MDEEFASFINPVPLPSSTMRWEVIIPHNVEPQYMIPHSASPHENDLTPAYLSEDPFESVFRGKRSVLKAAIQQVVREIRERKALHTHLNERLNDMHCTHKSRLYRAAPWGDESPFSLGDHRRRAAIEKELAAVDAERRREKAACLKDIAALKKELRTLIREYLDEIRKEQVMRP